MTETEAQKKCPYCDFDKNGNGLEYYTDQPVDEKKLNRLDGYDGDRVYLHKNLHCVVIATNGPDEDLYGREETKAPVNFCPFCGRRLNDDQRS